MLPRIYTLKNLDIGKLSVMAKPVSGEWIEDEFIGFKRLEIDCIVSLLEKDEEAEVGLKLESQLCAQNGIEFLSFESPDRNIPNKNRALGFATQLVDRLNENKHVAIHCRAGIGRTGIMASAVLVKLGVDPMEAMKQISLVRGVEIPDTQEQKEWVLSLANAT